jgi:Fe-S cluster assembly protein SufD
MSETLVVPATYAARLEAALALPQPTSVSELRSRAFERFVELGFPNSRQEEWRFTNVAPVVRQSFDRPAAAFDAAAVARARAPHRLADCDELVVVDGRLAPELGRSSGELDPRLLFGAASRLGAAGWSRVEAQFGRHANFVERPFAALASALFEDPVLVVVPAGVELARPLHVLHFTTAAQTPVAVFPRLLVVGENGSRATVIETHVGLDGTGYLSAPVTELVAGPDAAIDHYKVQREAREAFHLGLLQVDLERNATVSTQTFSFGAAIARHDVEGVLGGEGAEATLNGLYLVRGRQLADFHMRVDHAKPHTASHELFKGVLDERGRGVFNGRIHVHPHAQKTDAKQTSRNLLLSDEALVNANPQLEIFADDVKCTHGSTVGQLDELAVFYLRSRGIGLEAARSLLTYAFASDLVERVRVPALHHSLQEFLLAWIPQGEIVREAI